LIFNSIACALATPFQARVGDGTKVEFSPEQK